MKVGPKNAQLPSVFNYQSNVEVKKVALNLNHDKNNISISKFLFKSSIKGKSVIKPLTERNTVSLIKVKKLSSFKVERSQLSSRFTKTSYKLIPKSLNFSNKLQLTEHLPRISSKNKDVSKIRPVEYFASLKSKRFNCYCSSKFSNGCPRKIVKPIFSNARNLVSSNNSIVMVKNPSEVYINLNIKKLAVPYNEVDTCKENSEVNDLPNINDYETEDHMMAEEKNEPNSIIESEKSEWLGITSMSFRNQCSHSKENLLKQKQIISAFTSEQSETKLINSLRQNNINPKSTLLYTFSNFDAKMLNSNYNKYFLPRHDQIQIIPKQQK